MNMRLKCPPEAIIKRERPMFEAWAIINSYPMTKDAHGDYEHEATYDAWEGWFARADIYWSQG